MVSVGQVDCPSVSLHVSKSKSLTLICIPVSTSDVVQLINKTAAGNYTSNSAPLVRSVDFIETCSTVKE